MKYKQVYRQKQGVPLGYSHNWSYPNGRWNETKIGKNKWKFRFKSLKRRGGSSRGGPPIGYKIIWKINAIQRARKTGRRTYQTDMYGVKKAIGWYDPKKRRWVKARN